MVYVGDKIIQAVCESFLLEAVETLKTTGWSVEDLSPSETGYLMIITGPDKSPITVAGQTPKEVLDDLIRNLTQIGALSKELREMFHRAKQQIGSLCDSFLAEL